MGGPKVPKKLAQSSAHAAAGQPACLQPPRVVPVNQQLDNFISYVIDVILKLNFCF
jgi:hypothetical protein